MEGESYFNSLPQNVFTEHIVRVKYSPVYLEHNNKKQNKDLGLLHHAMNWNRWKWLLDESNIWKESWKRLNAQYMHCKKSAEQNKLPNTCRMTHCLGEIHNRTQRRGKKISENCNHNNYKINDTEKEKLSKNIVIEPIPCSTQIRFLKKSERKSQMLTRKMMSQDQSSILNNRLSCDSLIFRINVFKRLKS